MAAPAYLHPSQSLRSSSSTQSPYPLTIPAHRPFEHEPTAQADGPPTSVLIRRLPKDIAMEQLRLMVVWSNELQKIELLQEPDEDESASALMTFRSPAGASEAKKMLHGKRNMVVEILGASRAYGGEPGTSASSASSSSATSSAHGSRQPSRYNGSFAHVGKISPPMSGVYGSSELPNPEDSARYQNLFSPQSPIGNHLTDRPRISGKSLINNDTADDDETGELLKDPVAYAENGAVTSQRRATAPQLPIAHLASLSLNPGSGPGSSSLPPYGHQTMSGHHASMSPTGLNGGAGHGLHYPMVTPQYGRHSNFPPVNPADQNPPCNTLYVGNLPIDTSEEELKAMFSKQRGYKRLCFRTKQNGPMCFVEFEDVTFATKALNELYGQPLHNSVKGGIRLSFSKNPLGVRSGQTSGQGTTNSMAAMMAGSPNGFTTANGPPPGLSVPPGLSSGRYGGPSAAQSYTPAGFSANGSVSHSPWNGYNGPVASGGPNANMGGNGSTTYMSPHMLGR
ncbi:hypothetical protein ACHAQH_009819 [Verticillium albo-atrum]